MTLKQIRQRQRTSLMNHKTCAACDCELDGNSIKVKVGGNTVEVCCDDCAARLREAHQSVAKQGDLDVA